MKGRGRVEIDSKRTRTIGEIGQEGGESGGVSLCSKKVKVCSRRRSGTDGVGDEGQPRSKDSKEGREASEREVLSPSTTRCLHTSPHQSRHPLVWKLTSDPLLL